MTQLDVLYRYGVPPTEAAVLAVSGASLAPAASASTTPPSSTAQQRAEALIQPSLVFVDTTVTGVVAVPTSDGQVEYLDVSKGDNVGDYCSGAVVASSGTILSAGHCFYKGDLDYSLVEAIYNRPSECGREYPAPPSFRTADTRSDRPVEEL